MTLNHLVPFFVAEPAVPDIPGSLTVTATQTRRGANVTFTLTDRDGIASVASTILMASDGTVRGTPIALVRVNSSTFSADVAFGNDRWRNATFTVTYTDSNGVQFTLTQAYTAS